MWTAACLTPLTMWRWGISTAPRIWAARGCGTVGSPLKLFLSEAGHQKSVTVVGTGGKGDLQVRTVPLCPRRDLTQLRGSYMELTARDYYTNGDFQQNYLHITLTDEQDVPDAMVACAVFILT